MIAQKTTLIGTPDVQQVTFSNEAPFALICGPCQIESYDHALKTAEVLKNICQKLNIGLVYKSSYDKANRTSHTTGRGVGIEEGLRILGAIRKELGLPVLTDIHDITQVAPVAEVVDVLQIPAFLCRQTDLVQAAAKTLKAVNIKKGQFLAPNDMPNVAAKVSAMGNENILLTERGTTFGYGNLVVDMRTFPIMKQTGYPVVLDATHSVQMPGAAGGSSGGKREFVEPLARAAAAIGVAGFFMEAHECPDRAPSDGPNMIPLEYMEGLLTTLKVLDNVAKERAYQEIRSV